jgi:hypothetical protein
MKKATTRMTQTEASQATSELAIDKLEKVAFGNVADFARFYSDGRIEIFDWEKHARSAPRSRWSLGRSGAERMPERFVRPASRCPTSFRRC